MEGYAGRYWRHDGVGLGRLAIGRTAARCKTPSPLELIDDHVLRYPMVDIGREPRHRLVLIDCEAPACAVRRL